MLSVEALRMVPFENSTVEFYRVDLANLDELEDFSKSWEGELWGLVNNAGICMTRDIIDESDGDIWDIVLRTNLTAPYELTKRLLPKISRPGRILNISSQLGLEGRAGYSAYCASKFGLVGLTKCWAKELGQYNITVNAICPGWVDTEMTSIDLEGQAARFGLSVESYKTQVCLPLELRRFNTSDEVADLASYLLSDAAAGITGRDWLMQTLWNQS